MKLRFSVLVLALFAPVAVAAETRQWQPGQPIGIAPGAGVTITFIPSQRVIQKVWLDDPTWLVIDADGCLAGLSQECKRTSATTLHLRRIKPLRIQAISSTGRSQLTVITRGQSGDLQISVFQLVQKSSSEYSVIEVAPNTQMRVDVASVRRGRTVAQRRGWMLLNDPLYNRITQFLRLSSSQSPKAAASSAGVSLELIEKLSQLGQSPSPFLESRGAGGAGESGRLQ